MQGQKSTSSKLHRFWKTIITLTVWTVSGKSIGNDLRMLPEHSIYAYTPSCHRVLVLCKKLFLKLKKKKTTPNKPQNHSINKKSPYNPPFTIFYVTHTDSVQSVRPTHHSIIEEVHADKPWMVFFWSSGKSEISLLIKKQLLNNCIQKSYA